MTTNRYYIGYSADVNNRLLYHNSGLNISTRNRGPWVLRYQELFENKPDALKRERFLKKQKNHQFYQRLIAEVK